MDDLTGHTIKGYRLLEHLDSGGFGAVYRAHQESVDREVAVKIILPEYANKPQFIRRFEIEAHLVARIEHPHIVPLYDYWRDPDGAYLVMRWLRGGSLRTRLNYGPLPPEMLATLLEQVGGALAAAHRRGIVHRDLKPGNILLDEEGNAYLADFGIAKDLGSTGRLDETGEGMVIGSPAYLSPEQIESRPVTPQSDIYSLGVMVFQLLTGELPFKSDTPVGFYVKHIRDNVPALQVYRPELPTALNAVIQRATAKNPSGRYADVIGLAEDFQRVLGATGSAALAPDADEPRTPVLSDISRVQRDSTGSGKSGRRRTGYETVVYDATTLPEFGAAQLENPYKGLRAFQEADESDFFGRTALVQHLLARVAAPDPLAHVLVVVGPSGSGKSSVVRAGVLPALRRGALPESERWFVAEMMPGDRPMEDLATALLGVAVQRPDNLLEQLQEDEGGLERVLQQLLPPGAELLLLIDQFEELFTLTEDESVRAHFLNSLLAAVMAPDRRLRLLLTLRADFYDRPLLYPGFSDVVRRRTEVVVPLAPDELEEAIVRPAARIGVTLDPELVAAIVRDVGEQPGALPLLQYVLTELFERRTGPRISLEVYDALGGVRGALARSADEIYERLDTQAQETARQLFLRLVTLGEGAEDTRRRVPRTELAAIGSSDALLEAVIGVYSNHRLLTFDRDPMTRVPTIEIAHEALIRSWGLLRQWLDASRDDLRIQRRLSVAAVDWAESQRDGSFLAVGARLEQFALWAAETPLALNQMERAYLDASLQARDAELAEESARQEREAALEQARAQAELRARSAQRLRLFVVALAAVLALALLAAAFAFNRQFVAQQAQSEAENQRQTAIAAEAIAFADRNLAQTAQAQTEQQRQIVNTQRLAFAAQSLSRDNPETALLLAYEAAAREDSPVSSQALRDALDQAIWQPTRLDGHSDELRSAVFSSDGGRVATASTDTTAKIWDAATGKELATLRGHSDEVLAVIFSPDGQRIATASADMTAKLWDAASGSELLSLRGHGDKVLAVAFSPDGQRVATSSDDTTAKLWDANTGREVATLQGHSEAVSGVAFSPDGQRLVTISNDKTAKLWDARSGQELATLQGHGGPLYRVVFSPDGQRLLTTSEDRTAKLWEVASGKDLVTFQGHADAVVDAGFSPDVQRIVTASEDGTAKVWDVATGAAVATLRGHTGEVRSAGFSPDGQSVLTASDDRLVKLWSISGQLIATLEGHADRMIGAVFSPDGEHVLSVARDNAARMWNRSGGQIVLTLKGHSNHIRSIAFSPDGKYIATASSDKTARIWDAQTGAVLLTFKGHDDQVDGVAFSPDGGRVATSSRDETAKVWEAATGHELMTFRGHTGRVFGVVFSPDGRRIATASDDKTAKVWDVERGSLLLTLEGHTDGIRAVSFSPDGRRIATASDDKTAKIWDAENGSLLLNLVDNDGDVRGAIFSSDGQHIFTAATDQVVRVWDAASGQLQRIMRGHTGSIYSMALSKDGVYLLTASQDRTARIWDAASGQLLATLRGHTGALRNAAFSPDGQFIITASEDQTAHEYLVQTNGLLKLAACRVGRGLTEDEIQRFQVAAPLRFDFAARQCVPNVGKEQ